MKIKSLKGVNLGGWLVLERWITPSIFNNTTAIDEYSLCSELGAVKSRKLLEKHRKNFITTADFKWIKDNGAELLRIPVGYWIFGDKKPYLSCIEYLDFAFKNAEKFGLEVIIDFHGAAGSQNSKQHSGQKGLMEWYKSSNQSKSLQVIERLAKRYGKSPSLYGLELLNEPDSSIPYKTLYDFYVKGYKIVRKYCSEEVAVIISDQFRPFRWRLGLGKRFKNVVLDIHLYQIFGKRNKSRKYRQQIQIVKYVWRLHIWIIQRTIPVLIGEWSAVSNKSLGNNSQEYMNLQMQAFSTARGWCYWTYKTEHNSSWSYRFSVNRHSQRLNHR